MQLKKKLKSFRVEGRDLGGPSCLVDRGMQAEKQNSDPGGGRPDSLLKRECVSSVSPSVDLSQL